MTRRPPEAFLHGDGLPVVVVPAKVAAWLDALVDRIAERLGYVERAWQLKLQSGQEANVPWRNQQVIDKIRARASQRGVPPDLCEALWRQMIGWFIQYEEEKLRDQIERKPSA